ncbi:MAG: type II secretion system GspH family protein [Patescibacteria group bacterium]|nr:type II secretion system GspH family protein [Patescibacteria group bacterium]
MGKKFSTFNFSAAFTLIELLVVIAVIGVLYAISIGVLQPDVQKKRVRDAQRLADLGRLQSVIEAYISDHGVPPDVSGLVRVSNVPVSSGSNPSRSDGSGWLGVDLSSWLDKLPVDPLNAGSYVYRYERVGGNYELDAGLEYYTNLMLDSAPGGDGGNSDNRLEKGTDLTILGN